ncbi:Transcriptional regulator PadR-like family protein [Pseudonocardia thermophila]|jgi:Predicted transcriptional regulators|uniref:Transcriptional regulator PadR-like family protein n=1 Tax=Pseudonocardia thermophila TaxID=1848 RepID=A0A1M6SYV8_PSETH|nr:PadR family transcriptional regulator [Pseudonocardia thermophila]SHK49891.1 Transcriptional regulator PadR-like family protein [Pseudonocardia thermophila]
MEPLRRVTAATVDVLEVLLSATEPVWGLEIVRATGRPAGSVYPILGRLEEQGIVASEWEQQSERVGPRRRYYRLTEDGATEALRACAAFAASRHGRAS